MSEFSRVPKSRRGIRDFYRHRAGSWAQRTAELGIDPAQAAELATLVIETEQAYMQQLQAMRTAQGTTLRYNALVKELGAKGAMVIKRIRAHVAYHGGSLAELASLAPPDKKSPIGPPGVPYELTTTLAQGGELMLKWQCRHPKGAEGTAYSIFRRIGHDGAWEYVGNTGKKTIIDDRIPPGTTNLTYRIQAFRTTGPGPAAEFNVNFGGGRMPEVQVMRRMAA